MMRTGLGDSTIVIVADDTTLGHVVALNFVRAGSQRIGIVSSDATSAEAAAQAVFAVASGMWAVSASGDLSSPEDARRMVDELAASLGDADIVVSVHSGSEVFGHVAGQTMSGRAEGVVIKLGPADAHDIVAGVAVRTDAVETDCPAEELAASIVETARAGWVSLDAGHQRRANSDDRSEPINPSP